MTAGNEAGLFLLLWALGSRPASPREMLRQEGEHTNSNVLSLKHRADWR